MSVFPVADPHRRGPGLDAAVHALAQGRLIVLPTDTVYGVGADAFNADAVAALLAAKGRGRDAPPPVLVARPETIDELTIDLPPSVRALVAAFWPGALTIICRAQPALRWDLGETNGTVAVRMPDHEATLALLERTGPLAVSSANTTGRPPARTIADAQRLLGSAVDVFLDSGPSPGSVASTIVDATGESLKVVRAGAVPLERLRAVAGVTVEGAGDS